MHFTRSIAAAALASGLVLYASPAASAASLYNEARTALHAYCQNEAPKAFKGICMKGAAEALRSSRENHRNCLANPPDEDQMQCDDKLAEDLQHLINRGSTQY